MPGYVQYPYRWSENGRYLVTVSGLSNGSRLVWRYDYATGVISKWPCGGCVDAVVAGNQIVAVDSKLQLLRFPLGGGKPKSPLAIKGLPSWSRSPGRGGSPPAAVGGTAAAVLLTWPIVVGANNAFGTFVLVGLDGRYVRTVVGPGRSGDGVPLGPAAYDQGIAMEPGNGSALVNEFGVDSACQESGNLARISLASARNVTYPNPHGPEGSDVWAVSIAVDTGGNGWAVFTATTPTCIATPPRLYEWTGRGWASKGTNIVGVAFGPRNQMVLIERHLTPALGPGTLVVDLSGHQVSVASGVLGVTVPRQ